MSTFICVAILTIFVIDNEYSYHKSKEEILENSLNQFSGINRRLIIGFKNKNEIKELSKNGLAGIFLTKRNIEGETFESLKAFLAELQEERKQFGLPNLIVTTDQEGGPVSRLSPFIKKQKSLATALKDKESIFKYGEQQGMSLKKLGVNVNFSPVVDLKPLLPPSKLDFHSLISTRAISSNPQEVIDVSLEYIKGLEHNNITATLKHFPGLSRVQTDTHHFSVGLNTDVNTLKNSDWLPFIELMHQTKSWLMLSHLILEKVDDVNPVSTSKKVIDGLIRRELKIKGVLVTDDLTMGATYNRGFCKSIVQSYSTSVDYLLIAYDYEKYYDAVRCLKNS